jgi:outer membrane immunogenic protein
MRNRLISGLAGAVFSFAASGLAFAADMAVKAPPPAPAPLYSWTGFYIGLNAGGSWSTETTTTSTACNPPNGHYCGDGNVSPAGLANLPAISADGSGTFHNSDFTGGVQAGYNWQSGNWVLGGEADVEAYRANITTSLPGSIQVAPALLTLKAPA